MKKVNIEKNEIIKLYFEKELTMQEIADIYKVNRTTISNRFKEFNLKKDSTQRKYKKVKSQHLTKEQISLIVGSTLGDGSIILNGRRKNAYFKVSHCEKQKDYIYWKHNILKNYTNKISKYIDKRGNSIMYNLHTISHEDLNALRILFYNENKKIITKKLTPYLDPLSLAVWFMDDGSRSGKGNRISTDGFSKDEHFILKEMLKTKFNLNANILSYERNNKKYYYLSFKNDEANKMTKIIKPYIVNCMKYKLVNF